MFNKNAYFIPQVSSSLHHRTTGGDFNGVEMLFHHHNPDMFPGHYLATNAPVADASTLLNHDNGGLSGDSFAMASTFQRKQASKKDRHSKIYTSQGPRDRRVRLSIGIARKFFDLQETLGFDKPSKTLDWLLTKSKAAIKELLQSNEKASSSPSEGELLSSAGYGEASENGGNTKRKSKAGKDTTTSMAKESRAKARARARERTREKMCIKQFNGSGLNPSIIPVQNGNNRHDFFQISAGCNNNNVSCSNPLTNEAARDDLIQESVVIKRKSKNTPSFFGFQQNVFVSRDSSSNSINPSANATENWDVSTFTSQSNMYAIYDQHKFINSNSNI